MGLRGSSLEGLVTAAGSHRAEIPPVPSGEPRPLWSVMIPTYNGGAYLREALASVLAQDPGPETMQIEVVDDASTEGDPAALVEELGAGRVDFFRQPENRGFVRNFETCLERARGRVVHLLHDDDCVRPGFYERLGRAFEEQAEIGAAFCRHVYMDEEGHWQSLSPLERREPGVLEGWLEQIAAGQRLATPAVAVRREVYERLGGFDRRMGSAGEDWEMWVRIAAHYPVWFEPEPLAAYRVQRPDSLVKKTARTGGITGDMARATAIVESYLGDHLEPEAARRAARSARTQYASWAIRWGAELLEQGEPAAALGQARAALRCAPYGAVARSLAAAYGRAGARRGRAALARGLRRARPG
jgi:hypothetical protein